jgi:hypothetical protein
MDGGFVAQQMDNSNECACVFLMVKCSDRGPYVVEQCYQVKSLVFLELSPCDDVYKHIPRS